MSMYAKVTQATQTDQWAAKITQPWTARLFECQFYIVHFLCPLQIPLR